MLLYFVCKELLVSTGSKTPTAYHDLTSAEGPL